jgi:hypothetical protein
MVAPDSRYANLGESTFRAPDGRVAVYLGRRILPEPAAVQGALAATRPGERVDTLAARALGSVKQFYRICDANGIDDPFEVAEAGRTRVYLPAPPSVAGVSR